MTEEANYRSGSTTFAYEWVKIRRPARVNEQPRAQRGTSNQLARSKRGWWGLSRRNWFKPAGLRMHRVDVRGEGPGVWVEARGRSCWYPWDTAVFDILADINGRWEHRQ